MEELKLRLGKLDLRVLQTMCNKDNLSVSVSVGGQKFKKADLIERMLKLVPDASFIKQVIAKYEAKPETFIADAEGSKKEKGF